jgi:hypothetical protein
MSSCSRAEEEVRGLVEQPGPFTVIVFKHIQFDASWTKPEFWIDDNFPYTATADGATLIVVEEGTTGGMTTYWFRLQKGQVIQVSRGMNLVFIPAICIKKGTGDATSCKG